MNYGCHNKAFKEHHTGKINDYCFLTRNVLGSHSMRSTPLINHQMFQGLSSTPKMTERVYGQITACGSTPQFLLSYNHHCIAFLYSSPPSNATDLSFIFSTGFDCCGTSQYFKLCCLPVLMHSVSMAN